MFEIEKAIRKIDSVKGKNEVFKTELYLSKDGIRYEDVYVTGKMGKLKIVSPYVETGQELLNFNLFHFPNDASLSIQLTDDWKGFGLTLTISSEGDSKARYVTISLSPILLNWKYPYSFTEFRKKFIQVLDSIDNSDKFVLQYSTEVIEIMFTHEFSRSTIIDEIDPHIKQIEDVYDKITDLLQIEKSTDSLIARFDFPEEIKIYCRQYLEYFAQFLLDLGINASSSIKEEAGKVLFSVTPPDDIEALDKIREALAIYLGLPSNPILNYTGDRTVDMVLSGARANIKHLESQLELAIAKLQFKEATLELKDATNQQHQLALRQKDETIKELQEILSRGNIFEESLERVEINGEVVEDVSSLYRFSREDDIEVEATPILDENNEETRIGLVKVHEVTKFKDYGVSFDLPKAIRDLMDYFKRNKNK